MVEVREGQERSAACDEFAREYGFADWSRLVREVVRRETLNSCDLARVRAMLEADPALATEPMEHWCDHSCVEPLNYIAMIRFDAERLGLSPDLVGTGDVARALLAAGAPVDGRPGTEETPLITAASYGDADVARALVEARRRRRRARCADLRWRARLERADARGGLRHDRRARRARRARSSHAHAWSRRPPPGTSAAGPSPTRRSRSASTP